MTTGGVLVDLGVVPALSDDDLHGWAKGQRVFISSVIAGMEDERAEVARVLSEIGVEAVWFEKFGGRDDDAESAYLAEVASCDIYVGLLGERYGRPAPTGYSATHAEYREALRRGLRISLWVASGPLSGPQQDFVDEVRVFRATGSYANKHDLADGVAMRLRAIAGGSLSPWIKLGPVVFRARGIRSDGARVRIDARIRDASALAALEKMRPAGSFRTQEMPVTWNGRSVDVRVSSVETETAAGRGGTVAISGEVVNKQTSSRLDMSFEGRSPDDLVELAVRIGIFGEENPLGRMSFLAEFRDPFEIINALELPEDDVRPIVHLLVSESLVGSGRAERVTNVEIGPPHNGRRRVALSWLPPTRYVNETPAERHVEGEARC